MTFAKNEVCFFFGLIESILDPVFFLSRHEEGCVLCVTFGGKRNINQKILKKE